MSKHRTIHGAEISTLSTSECLSWVNWLRGEDSDAKSAPAVNFALAHCDSGVTWAFLDAKHLWCLGSSLEPDLCPTPSANHLQELRFVGPSAEVLIWREGDRLRGRILSDRNDNIDPHLQPLNEPRQLLGKPTRQVGEFILYVDSGGAQHFAPSTFPSAFEVRQYLEEDPESGAVRVAASRWVV